MSTYDFAWMKLKQLHAWILRTFGNRWLAKLGALVTLVITAVRKFYETPSDSYRLRAAKMFTYLGEALAVDANAAPKQAPTEQ